MYVGAVFSEANLKYTSDQKKAVNFRRGKGDVSVFACVLIWIVLFTILYFVMWK